jgi:AraC-like DNA-binding protein
LGDQLIDVGEGASARIARCFGALEQVVHHTEEKSPLLIHSYLHSLLTELDILYFKKPSASGSTSSAFTQFRLLVNERLRAHPTIASLAVELNLSESRLYSLVKSTTGLSPKEYLLNRLILEARRCLFYKEHSPKELSWELGFNDPNYFFRVFKKYSGRTVRQFLEELKEMHL